MNGCKEWTLSQLCIKLLTFAFALRYKDSNYTKQNNSAWIDRYILGSWVGRSATIVRLLKLTTASINELYMYRLSYEGRADMIS